MNATPSRWRVAAPLVVLVTVLTLAARDVGAVTTWLYPLAWYPLLALLDGCVVLAGGESLADRPRALGAMLWWSAVIWFAFEALNLRLANWYYVYVPVVRWQRWAGSALAFATVVPAILLPLRLLERLGWGDRLVTRPLPVGRRDLPLAAALGVALLGAVLVAPRLLYPLAWGAVWLVAEPLLRRVDPDASLFHDIAQGRFSRIARLMAAGLIAGVCWESLNTLARMRWIYTVPFLEHVKIFEMPPVGFVGFPFFALEAWSLYHLLRRWPRWWVVGAAGLGILATLSGMDRRTFASTIPYARQLPGVTAQTAQRLEQDGLRDAFAITRGGVAALIRSGLSSDDAARLYETARLAALRGVGAANAAALVAAGYATVEQLGAADPLAVWLAVRRRGAFRPTAAEVRVWVTAAKGHHAL